MKPVKSVFMGYESTVLFLQHLSLSISVKRKKAWTPAFLNPGFASAEGHSQLSFHMGLLNGT